MILLLIAFTTNHYLNCHLTICVILLFETYTKHAGSSLLQNVQLRDQVLDLQRREFVRIYSPIVRCKYVLCLNERNSAILVIIPSTSTWMSVIRDTINSITSQLNSCITRQTSFSGRTAVSECIQSVSLTSVQMKTMNNFFDHLQTIGMLPFYSRYLAETVEANLKAQCLMYCYFIEIDM